MKIAAFKLKVDSDKTRIGLVDIQKNMPYTKMYLKRAF